MEFVIMDLEEDIDIPLILGPPFMLAAKLLWTWGMETWR